MERILVVESNEEEVQTYGKRQVERQVEELQPQSGDGDEMPRRV